MIICPACKEGIEDDISSNIKDDFIIAMDDDFNTPVAIANLHAITVPIEAKELRQNTKDLIALYIACGLDPKKVTLFLQSDVDAHAKLGWIMNCMSYMGELQRMTQYKAKVAEKETVEA